MLLSHTFWLLSLNVVERFVWPPLVEGRQKATVRYDIAEQQTMKEKKWEKESEQKERDGKNWCGSKLSHYSWQKSRCRCGLLPRQQPGQESQGHTSQLAPWLPCCPVTLSFATFSSFTPLLILHLPFRVLELCRSSQKCHRQSCVASRRQQPQGNSKAKQTRILWQPTTATFAPGLPPSSSPLSPTNCKLAMTFTLQLLLCLDISRWWWMNTPQGVATARDGLLCSLLLLSYSHPLYR